MKNIVCSKSGRRRHDWRRRRGAAIVEGAIVIGIFLTMLLSMLDLGLAVLQKNVVAEGARSIAREAMMHGSMAAPQRSTWGPQPSWWSPAYGSVTLAADGSATVDANGTEMAAVQPILLTLEPEYTWIYVDWPDGGNRPGQRVRVWVFYWHKSLLPLSSGGYLLLHSRCVMRIAH